MQREFICGDCMNFLPDFPDNYFDVAVVDPPYGIKEHGGTRIMDGTTIRLIKNISNNCLGFQRIKLSGDVIILITQWRAD